MRIDARWQVFTSSEFSRDFLPGEEVEACALASVSVDATGHVEGTPGSHDATVLVLPGATGHSLFRAPGLDNRS